MMIASRLSHASVRMALSERASAPPPAPRSPNRRLLITWFAVAAFVADRIGAYLLGTEGLLPRDAGLLLVWAVGHCDGMDGPVVTLARKALKERNVNVVLPWVTAADEAQIREAFEQALAVRKLGAPAEQLADMHFFETLVRVHRAAEGAPYTGLKPAGRDLGPAIPAADRALEDGSIDVVAKLLVDAVRMGLHERFHAAAERRKFDVNDVAAGREYVAAYVSYIHYVERLWQAATGSAHGHHPEHGSHEH
jgi:hypothetical protein